MPEIDAALQRGLCVLGRGGKGVGMEEGTGHSTAPVPAEVLAQSSAVVNPGTKPPQDPLWYRG